MGNNEGPANRCLVILDTIPPNFVHEDFAILTIDKNNVKAQHGQLIKHSGWCAIGVVFSKESVNFMIDFMKPIDLHMILVYTTENPIAKIGNSLSRPLLWTPIGALYSRVSTKCMWNFSFMLSECVLFHREALK